MDEPTFGTELRRLREERGWSLRAFADQVYQSKTTIWEWESGRKLPTADVAAGLDTALHSGHTLAELQAAAAQGGPQQQLQGESEQLAERLAALRSGDIVPDLDGATSRLAVDYLSAPGAALMDEISDARRQALAAMRTRRLRNHHQIRYLTADVGYLSGILAYAALDDGHPRAALAHTDAAWEAATCVGSDQLCAWVRGTQSLILRFGQRYGEALERAEDGLRYATSGTARARLLAGIGQCKANMGDARGVRRALADAQTAFDARRGVDEYAGLFTFSPAKLLYYSGSALIWLEGGDDARKARAQSHLAIELWRDSPDRSVADEALAHVYAATGSLQVRDLEEAADDLEPILSLPAESRVSWIARRMDRITGMLAEPPYDSDPLGRELLERIRAYA